MNRAVFQAQFTDLSSEQRDLLQEYYRLTKSGLSTSEEELDRLANIWKSAEEDLVLSKWLSLIDLLYTNVPFAYEADDDDRRAYMSEYIGLLANEQLDNSNAHLSKTLDQDAVCVGSREGECVLICPDGSGYVRRSSQEITSMSDTERENWSCDRCNSKLSEHKISCTETSVS